MNSDRLLRIFYSNRSDTADWQNLDEISWMMSEGMVNLYFHPLSNHKTFKKILSQIKNSHTKLIRTGESLSHMALKTLAAGYLNTALNIDEENIRFEHPLIGFEVDVIDKNLNYPAECGDTSAIKLEKYLSLPSTKNFYSSLPAP